MKKFSAFLFIALFAVSAGVIAMPHLPSKGAPAMSFIDRHHNTQSPLQAPAIRRMPAATLEDIEFDFDTVQILYYSAYSTPGAYNMYCLFWNKANATSYPYLAVDLYVADQTDIEGDYTSEAGQIGLSYTAYFRAKNDYDKFSSVSFNILRDNGIYAFDFSAEDTLGNFYAFSMSQAVEIIDMQWKYEPNTPTSVTDSMTTAEFDGLDYIYYYGYVELSMINADTTGYASFYLNLDALDTDGAIPAGVYSINDSGQSGTASASVGLEESSSGSEFTPSFYATLDNLYYQDVYYLQSGSVTVAKDSAAGTMSITVNAVSHYGSTVTLTYNGTYTPSGNGGTSSDYDFSYEPTTPTVINEVMTVDSVDTSWFASYGDIDLYLFNVNRNKLAAFYFFASGIDNTIGIPAGLYNISYAGTVGTVQASTGIQTSSYGSYAEPAYYALLDSEGYIQTIYWIVSGSVTISQTSANELSAEVHATSHNGSTINLYYNMETDAVDNISTEGDHARKLIEDGQLIIIRDGVRYNALGNIVR